MCLGVRRTQRFSMIALDKAQSMREMKMRKEELSLQRLTEA
jgi:hypothetical protein